MEKPNTFVGVLRFNYVHSHKKMMKSGKEYIVPENEDSISERALYLPVWNETDYLLWTQLCSILGRCEQKREKVWFIYSQDHVLLPCPSELNSEEARVVFEGLSFEKVVPEILRDTQPSFRSSRENTIWEIGSSFRDYMDDNSESYTDYENAGDDSWEIEVDNTCIKSGIVPFISKVQKWVPAHKPSNNTEHTIRSQKTQITFVSFINQVIHKDGVLGQILAGKDGEILMAKIDGISISGITHSLITQKISFLKKVNRNIPFLWDPVMTDYLVSHYHREIDAYNGVIQETTLFLN